MTSRRQVTTGAGERKARLTPPATGAPSPIDVIIASFSDLDAEQLRLQWRNHLGGAPPAHLPRWLLARLLAQRIQIAALGDLSKAARRIIREAGGEDSERRRGDGRGGDAAQGVGRTLPFVAREPSTREGVNLRAGAAAAQAFRVTMMILGGKEYALQRFPETHFSGVRCSGGIQVGATLRHLNLVTEHPKRNQTVGRTLSSFSRVKESRDRSAVDALRDEINHDVPRGGRTKPSYQRRPPEEPDLTFVRPVWLDGYSPEV